MKIRIIETGEMKELEIIGENGISWIEDLLGNHDAATYNTETEEYEMSQEDFEWWGEYIEGYQQDEEEIEALAEELEVDVTEIRERINEGLRGFELCDEHMAKQAILEEIRCELTQLVNYTNNIQEILDEQDISIRQMSKDLDLDYSVAHRIATREDLRTTSLGRLEDIARYLGVDITDLYIKREEI